jgi:Arc/MetJ family transcription regulator
MMRTNIVLDDNLVKEAFRHAPVKTKRELVDLALREFVAARKRRDVRELFARGGIREDYDYKALREGK